MDVFDVPIKHQVATCFFGQKKLSVEKFQKIKMKPGL